MESKDAETILIKFGSGKINKVFLTIRFLAVLCMNTDTHRPFTGLFVGLQIFSGINVWRKAVGGKNR
jgi:hypothetical protein